MRLITFLIAFIFISTRSLGSPEDLLKSPNRPTMKQFITALDPMPDVNPFKNLVNDRHAPYITSDGTEIILDLESTFPGALWAPLGRDSSIVADVLEAYAILNKQEDRVIRLNASGQSFKNSKESYLGLLMTAGLVDAAGFPLKRFVILDPTSWTDISQARNLLSVVYKTMNMEQYQACLAHVNVASLGEVPGRRNETCHVWIKDWFKSYHPQRDGDGNPSLVLTTSSNLSYLEVIESGEIAWHNKFETLLKQPDGTWKAEPGEAMSKDRRQHVLWLMYEVYKQVSSSSFENTLQRKARERGLNLRSITVEDQFDRSIFTQMTEKKERWAKTSNRRLQENITRLADKIKTKSPFYQIKNSPLFLSVSDRIAKMNLSDSQIQEILSTLNQNDSIEFLWELLISSEHPADAIAVLKLERQIKRGNSRPSLAKDFFYTFVAMNPSLDESLAYLSHLSQSDPEYLHIAKLAMRRTQTWEDYRKIPKTMALRRDADYQSARCETKLSLPWPRDPMSAIKKAILKKKCRSFQKGSTGQLTLPQ